MAGQHTEEVAGDEHVGPRIDRYLSGQLPAAEEVEVETHLLRCRRCRVEADEASRSAPPPAIATDAAPPVAPRRRRRAGASYVAAVVLGAAIGVGGWAWIHPTGSSTPVDQPIGSTAAPLTVSLTARPGSGEAVTAVVVGVRPGVRFTLLAVATDGRVYEIARATAVGGPQTVAGTVPVPGDEIRFFAVRAEDGTIVAAGVG